jgi:hypothetical protein
MKCEFNIGSAMAFGHPVFIGMSNHIGPYVTLLEVRKGPEKSVPAWIVAPFEVIKGPVTTGMIHVWYKSTIDSSRSRCS